MRPTLLRRHPRTRLYLPACCAALLSRDREITLQGKSDSVGRGGLQLLLHTLLKPPTPVTVSLAGVDPLRARVVWAGPTRRTDLGIVVPHGLRFVEEISEFTFGDLLAALREKAQIQRTPRLPIRLEIQVMNGDAFKPARTLNLSVAGAFITTPTPAAVGEEVLLHVALPGNRRPLYLSGQVVWQNSVRSGNGFQPGMGIAFRGLGTEETAALQHLLRGARIR